MLSITNLYKNYFITIFLGFYLLVALVNDGFMGTDEYWNAMVKYLPAQTSKITELVAKDDVKSPLQVMPMFTGAQLALKMNITHPYDQYRFTILFLTIINLLVFILALNLLAKYTLFKEPGHFMIFVGLMTFYFATAFALTRPMFEAQAAPWILLCLGFYLKYEHSNAPKDLILSTLAVSIAFVLRQQAGIGALTLPILLLWKRDIRGLFFCAIAGLVFFVLAGIPDLLLRGSFHHSLLAVTTYNIDHGHEYGNGSVLFYPLLLLGMSFFPFLITKDFNKTFLLSVLKRNHFSVLFIFLFVALHTYFPQKFERFLVPIIPLFLILLTPFIAHLFHHFKKYKIRLFFLMLLNSSLLIAAVFQPSQGNIIKMALFIDQHPKIEKIFNFESTIEWLPEKFIAKNSHFQIISLSSNSLADLDPSLCQNIIVINEFLYEQKKELFSAYDIKAKFGVNFIESLAYRFNKKNNIRRSPLVVLGCSHPN